MAAFDFERAIQERLAAAGQSIGPAVTSALAKYLGLLARWNRRINLTAFNLDQPTDHAIDRLIVEPVRAAAEVGRGELVAVDIGSGGGSPALPLKILLPLVQMTLIEARVRKSAFLREAARELDLEKVSVETFRLGRGGRAELNGTADVVTMRAVRADAEVLAGSHRLLRPGGRLVWFGEGTAAGAGEPLLGWSATPANQQLSFLRVLTKVD
jgi:16S rRNA (guanine527-N7)-methyltransferase